MVTSRNWCITLNNPTQDERNNTTNIFQNPNQFNIRYMVYQEEVGANGTPHFQSYVQFNKRVSGKQLKDIFGDRVHHDVARGSAEQNKAYCTKPEGRVDGPYEVGEPSKGKGTRTDIETFIQDAEGAELSEGDLIRKHGEILAKYPRFVQRTQRFFTEQRRVKLFEPRGWQEDLGLYLRGQPDERKIRWYFDETGNSGKSYFAKHFYIETDVGHDDGGGRYERPFIVTYGKWADIFYAYKKERMVIFDWPRDIQDSFPYAVMEMFKNGYFLNTKYESYPVYFDVPHVVVFANFMPDESKLSIDRWEIKTL